MPDDPRNDEALVAAMNRGGADGVRAFETLYRRHREFVFRVAMRIVGDENDALDVVQETFAYILRKTPGLVLTAKMTTFLFPVAKHQALARRKAKQRSTAGASEQGVPDATDDAPAPSASTLNESRMADLHAALGGLAPVHREVVLMRFVDDLSLAEIAAVLQVPVGTVKSRLHNALAALRDDPRVGRFYGLSDPDKNRSPQS